MAKNNLTAVLVALVVGSTSAAVGDTCDPQNFFDDKVVLEDDIAKLAYFETIDEMKFKKDERVGEPWYHGSNRGSARSVKWRL